MASSEFPLHLLQSEEQVRLLDDIDKLRSDGIQHHAISLPQLVVCGDQSSGKSSVLEALSNVRFPVDTGTCTRFAMELALRRSPDKKAMAKIIPGRIASADRQRRLADFKPSDVGLAGVPKLIEEARAAMGLSGDAVCDDVLRLEITGPDLPHLTLVDLPGLIADAKDPKDIELVENMVREYMKNPRSIILAIVSAQSDKQVQKVLRLAREYDPHGDRTVGVITKPDMLKKYRGSVAERNYVDMAKNQDPVSKLRLGWHVVRNADWDEKQEHSKYNRDESEREIFSQKPWNQLSRWQLGIVSLRDELTKHLFNQICSELPRVVKDIEQEEAECAKELKDLGEPRPTSKDQRKYLLRISDHFEKLVSAGLDGHWTFDPIFNAENMRLRAQIRNLNDAFDQTMKSKGHAFEYPPPIRHGPRKSSSSDPDPMVASRAGLLGKVNKILKSGRGQELPGMFDPILVTDIFREQSENWEDLACQHVEKVWQVTNEFLQNLLFNIAPARTGTAEAVLNGIISKEILSRKEKLDAKVSELLLPYVKNMPFCTASRMAASLKQIDLDDTKVEGGGSQPQRLGSMVDSDIDIDACSTLLRYSQAYYNVARETFIDNVATLAIENCLMTGLASIFSSSKILDMEDDELAKLAGESVKILTDRRYAEEKYWLLKQSLKTCRLHMSRRPTLREESQRGITRELAGPSAGTSFSPTLAPNSGQSALLRKGMSPDIKPAATSFSGAPAEATNQITVSHKNSSPDVKPAVTSSFGTLAQTSNQTLLPQKSISPSVKPLGTGLFGAPVEASGQNAAPQNSPSARKLGDPPSFGFSSFGNQASSPGSSASFATSIPNSRTAPFSLGASLQSDSSAASAQKMGPGTPASGFGSTTAVTQPASGLSSQSSVLADGARKASFGSPASASSKGGFGSGTSGSQSPFALSPQNNISVEGTQKASFSTFGFGSTPTYNGGFGTSNGIFGSSKPIFGAPKWDFGTSNEGLGSSTLSPNSAVKDDVPGRQSPTVQRTPSTSRATTPTSQLAPPNPSKCLACTPTSGY
jgi:hypothetical protein